MDSPQALVLAYKQRAERALLRMIDRRYQALEASNVSGHVRAFSSGPLFSDALPELISAQSDAGRPLLRSKKKNQPQGPFVPHDIASLNILATRLPRGILPTYCPHTVAVIRETGSLALKRDFKEELGWSEAAGWPHEEDDPELPTTLESNKRRRVTPEPRPRLVQMSREQVSEPIPAPRSPSQLFVPCTDARVLRSTDITDTDLWSKWEALAVKVQNIAATHMTRIRVGSTLVITSNETNDMLRHLHQKVATSTTTQPFAPSLALTAFLGCLLKDLVFDSPLDIFPVKRNISLSKALKARGENIDRFIREVAFYNVKSAEWKDEEANLEAKRRSREALTTLRPYLEKVYSEIFLHRDLECEMEDELRQELREAFQLAIEIKARLDVSQHEFSVFWPDGEGEYEFPNEDLKPLRELERGKSYRIDAVLFPGVKKTWVSGEVEGKCEVIHKARVSAHEVSDGLEPHSAPMSAISPLTSMDTPLLTPSALEGPPDSWTVMTQTSAPAPTIPSPEAPTHTRRSPRIASQPPASAAPPVVVMLRAPKPPVRARDSKSASHPATHTNNSVSERRASTAAQPERNAGTRSGSAARGSGPINQRIDKSEIPSSSAMYDKDGAGEVD